MTAQTIPWHCRLHLWHTWGLWVSAAVFYPPVGLYDGQSKTCTDCGRKRNR